MLNTPPLCLQHPSPCSHTSESRPQSHWTPRHNYWVTDASLWLSLKPSNENISCHINKPEISPPSVISGLQMWMRAPQTVIQGVWPPPPMVIAEGLGDARSKMNKETQLAPDSWGHGKGVEAVTPRLHLPTHRMLDALTWYLIFDEQTACSLCCKPVYSLTYPLPPWSSFLRATEMLSPGFGVLNIHTK